MIGLSMHSALCNKTRSNNDQRLYVSHREAIGVDNFNFVKSSQVALIRPGPFSGVRASHPNLENFCGHKAVAE
ncbi:hypothetical protein BDZ45DRAFT_289672 [Acephala macrosclerotiorum]|nr:hypothetical protein BDZ45DRAFT_289672 [Acephala macrosclerotiorum]